MDPADCKVLMDDNVHGMPDHKGVIEGFRCGTHLSRKRFSNIEKAATNGGAPSKKHEVAPPGVEHFPGKQRATPT